MLALELNAVEKDFGKGSIFAAVSCQIAPGTHTAICGPNGSGKSSLLKIISGFSAPSGGTVSTLLHNESISPEKMAMHTAYASPSLELPGELTLSECLSLHAALRPSKSKDLLLHLALKSGLENALTTRINQLSSGMLQRVKLILAFGTKANLLVLDEPAANLDQSGVTFFQETLKQYCQHQTVVVASNHHPEETFSSTQHIEIRQA